MKIIVSLCSDDPSQKGTLDWLVEKIGSYDTITYLGDKVGWGGRLSKTNDYIKEFDVTSIQGFSHSLDEVIFFINANFITLHQAINLYNYKFNLSYVFTVEDLQYPEIEYDKIKCKLLSDLEVLVNFDTYYSFTEDYIIKCLYQKKYIKNSNLENQWKHKVCVVVQHQQLDVIFSIINKIRNDAMNFNSNAESESKPMIDFVIENENLHIIINLNDHELIYDASYDDPNILVEVIESVLAYMPSLNQVLTIHYQSMSANSSIHMFGIPAKIMSYADHFDLKIKVSVDHQLSYEYLVKELFELNNESED